MDKQPPPTAPGSAPPGDLSDYTPWLAHSASDTPKAGYAVPQMPPTRDLADAQPPASLKQAAKVPPLALTDAMVRRDTMPRIALTPAQLVKSPIIKLPMDSEDTGKNTEQSGWPWDHFLLGVVIGLVLNGFALLLGVCVSPVRRHTRLMYCVGCTLGAVVQSVAFVVLILHAMRAPLS